MKYKVRVYLDDDKFFEEEFPDRASATNSIRAWMQMGYEHYDGTTFLFFPPHRITLVEMTLG